VRFHIRDRDLLRLLLIGVRDCRISVDEALSHFAEEEGESIAAFLQMPLCTNASGLHVGAKDAHGMHCTNCGIRLNNA
jgi:hypothetical protein